VRSWWTAGWLLAGILGGLVGTNAATAQEPGLMLELNRVEQQGDACRFDWRLTNRSDARIDDLAVEFVLFGTDGVNIARMPVPFGAVAANKSTLRSFVLRPFECARVGEALANEVTRCVAEPAFDCVAALTVSSRTAIALSR